LGKEGFSLSKVTNCGGEQWLGVLERKERKRRQNEKLKCGGTERKTEYDNKKSKTGQREWIERTRRSTRKRECIYDSRRN
jgi:hypothetical protein